MTLRKVSTLKTTYVRSFHNKWPLAHALYFHLVRLDLYHATPKVSAGGLPTEKGEEPTKMSEIIRLRPCGVLIHPVPATGWRAADVRLLWEQARASE